MPGMSAAEKRMSQRVRRAHAKSIGQKNVWSTIRIRIPKKLHRESPPLHLNRVTFAVASADLSELRSKMYENDFQVQ